MSFLEEPIIQGILGIILGFIGLLFFYILHNRDPSHAKNHDNKPRGR